MTSKSTNLKHQFVTDVEGFKQLFAQVEARNMRYRLLSQLGAPAALVWPLLILTSSFVAASLQASIGVVDVLLVLLGVFALQLIFVAAHFESHALFFDYADHVPGSRLVDRSPVYFAAFLHHHMRMSSPWYPDFAYTNEKGYSNIAISHWTSFSVLFGPLVWLPAVLAFLNPKSLWFFVGYELGAWCLPYAHGFQHSAVDRMGAFPLFVMKTLCALGIVASPADHKSHHSIAHRCVYQDFSSSGLYFKAFDAWINERWNELYDQAAATKTNLYDIVHAKIVYVYGAILFALPVVLTATID